MLIDLFTANSNLMCFIVMECKQFCVRDAINMRTNLFTKGYVDSSYGPKRGHGPLIGPYEVSNTALNQNVAST